MEMTSNMCQQMSNCHHLLHLQYNRLIVSQKMNLYICGYNTNDYLLISSFRLPIVFSSDLIPPRYSSQLQLLSVALSLVLSTGSGNLLAVRHTVAVIAVLLQKIKILTYQRLQYAIIFFLHHIFIAVESINYLEVQSNLHNCTFHNCITSIKASPFLVPTG